MWNNVDQRINRALNGVRKAFRTVLRLTRSDEQIQTVQASGLSGETLQDAELFQHYGLTSVPPAGTTAIALPLNGRTSHSVIIATEHASYRLTALKSGEVALYTDEGSHIVLKRDKIIKVTCDEYIVNCKRMQVSAEESVSLTAPQVDVTAAESVGLNSPAISAGGGDDGITAMQFRGTINATQDVTAAGKSLVGHRHPGDSGGVTGPPL
ncbi:phage baseplate assembly protein V [Erwinia psidii]|uniref:phage baseplate assembly protein V n=1 Tax=Erwinia psidii TaxID=69224 RepID=UPI00226B4547|nr:phage baseplate assembly protein V [Erwinia psidii]MCX8962130.1 phage baseplate assembly protein V [Erwinia psidii]